MTLDELKIAVQSAWQRYLDADSEMKRWRDEWCLTKAMLEAAEADAKIEAEVQRRLAAKEGK